MLTACCGADILRLKGILNVEDMDRPLVIHGVQHLFHPPALLDAWPDGDRSSRLVFITRDLDRATFERSLKEFTEGGPSTAAESAKPDDDDQGRL